MTVCCFVDLNGGEPLEKHTHEHDHLFIVTQGEAKIFLGDEEVIVKKDESFLMDGEIPIQYGTILILKL